MEHSPHPDRQKQLAVLLKKNNKFCVQVSQTYNQFWQKVLNSALHKKERARNLFDERKNIKLLENMHRRHGSKPSYVFVLLHLIIVSSVSPAQWACMPNGTNMYAYHQINPL